jgi:hypothetical protein
VSDENESNESGTVAIDEERAEALMRLRKIKAESDRQTDLLRRVAESVDLPVDLTLAPNPSDDTILHIRLGLAASSLRLAASAFSDASLALAGVVRKLEEVMAPSEPSELPPPAPTPMVAFAYGELDERPRAKVGDRVRCRGCDEAHDLKAGKVQEGDEWVPSDVLLFYSCGEQEKEFLGAIRGALLPNLELAP